MMTIYSMSVCPIQRNPSKNSNSYAAGLLRAAGLSLPRFPVVAGTISLPTGDRDVYAGWTKPVPKEKFGQ